MVKLWNVIKSFWSGRGTLNTDPQNVEFLLKQLLQWKLLRRFQLLPGHGVTVGISSISYSDSKENAVSTQMYDDIKKHYRFRFYPLKEVTINEKISMRIISIDTKY